MLTKQARYKKWHKEKGLCLDCSSPAKIAGLCLKHYWRKAVYDRRYANEHQEERSEYHKNRRVRLAEEGRCTHCGVPLVEGEGRQCVNCNEASKSYTPR